MAATITVVDSGTATASGANFDTASVSPESDKPLLAALAWSRTTEGPVADNSITCTGLGLSWTRLAERPGYFRRSLCLFEAKGTVTPGAVTFASADGGTEQDGAWAILQVNDGDASDATGATGEAFSGGAQTSLETTIPGTPTANDITLLVAMAEDDKPLTADAAWDEVAAEQSANNRLYVYTDSGLDQTPTETWSDSGGEVAAIGLIIVGAAAAGGQPAVKRMGGVKFAHSLGYGTW